MGPALGGWSRRDGPPSAPGACWRAGGWWYPDPVTGNVLLVGFMGAGKSSVGRLLARRLGRCFVETDDMITAREGRSIPEIFADKGEAYFRELEAEAVRLLRDKRGDVIATGGGLPCRDGRMDQLKAIGTVIWLAAEFDTLFERAQRIGGRPMLAGRSRDDARRLYDAREPFYRQADLAIDTTRWGPDLVTAELLKRLRAREARGPVAGARAGAEEPHP